MTSRKSFKFHIFVLKNKSDNSKIIEAKMKQLEEPLELPPTIENTNEVMRSITRETRKLKRDKQSYNSATEKERERQSILAYKEKMGTKIAKAIFYQKESMIKLMKTLPKPKHKQRGGPLTCIFVPVPKEGLELEYEAITDGPKIKGYFGAEHEIF